MLKKAKHILNNPLKTVQKELYDICLYEHNIVFVKHKADVVFDVPFATEARNLILELTEFKQFLNMVDLGNYNLKPTKEGQYFLANDALMNSLKLKEAIITNSYTTSLLLGIYLKFYKPICPTKAFKSKEEALEWLINDKSH